MRKVLIGVLVVALGVVGGYFGVSTWARMRAERELDAAFDVAEARFGLGRALRAFGDVTGARVEFERARTIFGRLGADIRRDAIDRALADLVEGPAPAGPSTV